MEALLGKKIKNVLYFSGQLIYELILSARKIGGIRTMFKIIASYFMLPLLLLLSNSSGNSVALLQKKGPEEQTGTLEKMIVASGNVAMDLDLNRVNGIGSTTSKLETLRFEVRPNSFFTILVFNNVLRGPALGSIGLTPQNSATLPPPLQASFNQLVIEKIPSSEPYDIVLRDGKTGFIFFNIEGNLYDYDAGAHLLSIKDGRLLISEEFANTLGRPSQAGLIVGRISTATTMYPIEVTTVANGAIKSVVMPAVGGGAQNPDAVHGPDIIVGDLPDLAQFGSAGTQVGLAVGTTSCNNGDQPVDWFALPNTDHPVIPQNLYRMSGGASNNDRFEQVGQSWMKHAFLALEDDACNFGCTTSGCTTGSHLCVGCSDPYDSGLNAGQTGLGSRAWVNPFTGVFPSNANNHTGHTHTGTSHRILVEGNDLNTTMNPGATYYAESQYIAPSEYTWCQANPGQCNMYNNASYRQFNVTGTTSFSFTPVGSTVRMTPAIYVWTGATINRIEPVPGVDGFGLLGFKVTNPSAGVWHYEYAIYNQNLDRGIQSFSVPLGCGITANNLGFHAPLNPPGFANDGTLGGAGYSNAAWTSNQTCAALSWSSETFAQNQNANAIRFGTLYNFRFDSNRPPQAGNATIGFFKTGAPMTVAILVPTPDTCNPVQLTDAVSRKTHGAAGTFDVDLPLSGEPGVECRSGGGSGDHTLIFTFIDNVVSGNASVTSGVGSVSGSPTFSGNAMTVNLTGVSDVQQITVTLSNVTDCFGSVLPDTPVSANMLIGDTTGNKTVNASDVAQVKAQVGSPVTSANFREDLNVDGLMNASDVGLVKANVGHSVP
jgi:hypothetical protein